MAADNRSLGRFMLSGIPPAPRGVPQIEVTFDIDANGILNVKAKDKATGKEQQITITASTNLSDEEVDRMKQEAEANAEADKRKKEEVETRNMGETMVYTTEKMLKEAGDKVSEDAKKDVEEKLTALKAALAGSDLGLIRTSADALATSAQNIGAAMYADAQKQEAASGDAGKTPDAGAESKDGSVEGDFTAKGD